MAFAKLGGQDEMEGYGPSKARHQKPLAIVIYVPDGGHTMQPPCFRFLCAVPLLTILSLHHFALFYDQLLHPSSNFFYSLGYLSRWKNKKNIVLMY